MEYEIGSRAGDYKILDVLGAGGMGKVYKVQNVISDRVEAMKVLLPNLEGDPELADRFVREIKVQARLDHPNIAALHTALRLDNQLVMLMEFVEGVTLEHMLKSGPLPVAKAVDYVAQVLSALAYAHAHGVVHRDIKPANMILTPGGVVKLMDFGIAKLTVDRKLTQTGATVGSLYYMSPEQIKGATDLDGRTDLYSLGIALYELLAGARPFQGDSEYSIMSAHLEKMPVPLPQVNPALPEALNAVVAMALEKDPAKRFQTADAFRNALLSVAPASVAAPASPAAAAPPPKPAARPAPEPYSAPMTPQPPQPPQQPVSKPGGGKGRALVLVGVALLALVAAAAAFGPKLLHRGEESPTAATPAATPATQTEAPASAAAVPAQSVPSTEPAATPQSTPAAAAQQTQPQRPGGPSRVPAQTSPRTAAPAQTSSAPAQTPYAPPQQAPAQNTQPAAPAVSPAEAAALNEVREQLPLLGVRASTVRSGLASLQRSQASQGLSLRADIVATAQRMDLQLSAAEDAAKRGDGTAAKKSLDAAERAVSKLESFLGH